MCILAVAVGVHPDFPIVCIHNREEDLARPTADPEEDERITCGHDLRAGGTWMGLNRDSGSFVALTNDRRKDFALPAVEERTSRGRLLNELLRLYQDETGERFGEAQFVDLGGKFSGFNMLHGNLFADVDVDSDTPVPLFFISNRPQEKLPSGRVVGKDEVGHSTAMVERLGRGVYCFSNGGFDDDAWPKVRHLRSQLAEVLANLPSSETCAANNRRFYEEQIVDVLIRRLEPVMTDTQVFPMDEGMRAVVKQLPLPAEQEHALQSIFVRHNAGEAIPPLRFTGTRQQTIVVRGRDTIYYMYRNCDEYPRLLLAFRKFRIPVRRGFSSQHVDAPRSHEYLKLHMMPSEETVDASEPPTPHGFHVLPVPPEPEPRQAATSGCSTPTVLAALAAVAVLVAIWRGRRSN